MKTSDDWEARHRAKAGEPPGPPSAWVMRQAGAFATGALVLYLASGRGRHALPLAALGFRVVALDRAVEALHALRAASAAVHTVAGDAGALPIRERAFDAIICVNFLDRALFASLHRWLRPAGRLVIETFTTGQLALPHGPRTRAHLLEPGELPRLVAPLRVVAHHEGLVRDAAGERYAAGVAAVNPEPA